MLGVQIYGVLAVLTLVVVVTVGSRYGMDPSRLMLPLVLSTNEYASFYPPGPCPDLSASLMWTKKKKVNIDFKTCHATTRLFIGRLSGNRPVGSAY